jgi:hypothetical protein
MIKKSLFAEELALGMQQKLANTDEDIRINSLVQAIDFLHNAMEILDDIGLSKKADKILGVIVKIATQVSALPSIDAIQWVLARYDLTTNDLKVLEQPTTVDNRYIKAKVTQALRTLGFSDDVLINFFGKKISPLLSPELAKHYLRTHKTLEEMIRVPEPKEESIRFEPGSEIEFRSLEKSPKEIDIESNPEIEFKSLAQNKLNDKAIKGLTVDKMIENLLDHGTVFNLIDKPIEVSDNNDSDDSETFEDEK